MNTQYIISENDYEKFFDRILHEYKYNVISYVDKIIILQIKKTIIKIKYNPDLFFPTIKFSFIDGDRKRFEKCVCECLIMNYQIINSPYTMDELISALNNIN